MDVREEVREHYAQAARSFAGGGSCGGQTGCGCADGSEQGIGSGLYAGGERAELPEGAVSASLGCGNPTEVAELRPGEVVLDLGSGGGIDVLLSARRVSPGGKAYGLDMTDEMLELAHRHQREAGIGNAEFLQGYIEDVPLSDGSVDVVISNCVINLSTDKPRVFSEIRRVLRPGGRVGISDIVGADELTPEQRAERGSHVGCIAGALSISEYEAALAEAGFTAVQIVPTHEVADGMFGAIVRAWAPVSPAAASVRPVH